MQYPDAQPCPVDKDALAARICADLPDGWIWEGADRPGTVMNQVVMALSEHYGDLHQEVCDMLPEFFCSTADKMLPEWNDDYGLPDDCGINDLCAKVAALGGARCEDIVELGQLIGYEICCDELPPNTQTGCWNLGCSQLAPRVEQQAGGSSLGVACLGYCEPTEGGPLGQEPLSTEICNIAGFYDVAEGDEVVEDACLEDLGCTEYSPPCYGTLICGYQAPSRVDEYQGNSNHFIVGLVEDQAPINGTTASCEPAKSIGNFQIGCDPLGTHVPGENITQGYPMTGCWNMGCTPLCGPPTDEVFCFVLQYAPAHLEPVRRWC